MTRQAQIETDKDTYTMQQQFITVEHINTTIVCISTTRYVVYM